MKHTHRIGLRVPAKLVDELKRQSQKQGVKPSVVVRLALDSYLKNAA